MSASRSIGDSATETPSLQIPESRQFDTSRKDAGVLNSRRRFLQTSGSLALGFAGLQSCLQPQTAAAGTSRAVDGFGPLVPDPKGLLDLPAGFTYRVVSRRGAVMDDGFHVPAGPDGMATFPGPDGTTILIRNHELSPGSQGPFGRKNELFSRIDRERVYDAGKGMTPHSGGTTTLVYDTREQKVIRQFLSLAGTQRNCSGGPTPWGSWVTCEETVDPAGFHKKDKFHSEKDHGYCFEVPATAEIGLADPVPLRDMGRFRHEAVAVDPVTKIVYETEDEHDGLLYRFLPNEPGKLAAGGRLQALALVDAELQDTRNWEAKGPVVEVGRKMPVRWIDMEEIDNPRNDLRLRGFKAGAARFARGEGMWEAGGSIYFACTNGGKKKLGQIWRYEPGRNEGTDAEADEPGTLTLFIEPNDSRLMQAADNLTIAPCGDLVICEDRSGEIVRLVGVTGSGDLYTFALSHMRSEFAGSVFSPDGTTLFVNCQGRGLTFAITGPWMQNVAS